MYAIAFGRIRRGLCGVVLTPPAALWAVLWLIACGSASRAQSQTITQQSASLRASVFWNSAYIEAADRTNTYKPSKISAPEFFLGTGQSGIPGQLYGVWEATYGLIRQPTGTNPTIDQQQPVPSQLTITCYYDGSNYVGAGTVFWGSGYKSLGDDFRLLVLPQVVGTLYVTVAGDGEWCQVQIDAPSHAVSAFTLYPSPPGISAGNGAQVYAWNSPYTGQWDPAIEKMGGYSGGSGGTGYRPCGVGTDVFLSAVSGPGPTTKPSEPEEPPDPAVDALLEKVLDGLHESRSKIIEREEMTKLFSLSKDIKEAWESSGEADPVALINAAFQQTELGGFKVNIGAMFPAGVVGDHNFEIDFKYDEMIKDAITQFVGYMSGPTSFSRSAIRNVAEFLLDWWFIQRVVYLVLYAIGVESPMRPVEAT